jgi:hypothetical protein
MTKTKEKGIQSKRWTLSCVGWQSRNGSWFHPTLSRSWEQCGINNRVNVQSFYLVTSDAARHYYGDAVMGNVALNEVYTYLPAVDGSGFVPSNALPNGLGLGRSGPTYFIERNGLVYDNGALVEDSNGNQLTTNANGWVASTGRLIPARLAGRDQRLICSTVSCRVFREAQLIASQELRALEFLRFRQKEDQQHIIWARPGLDKKQGGSRSDAHKSRARIVACLLCGERPRGLRLHAWRETDLRHARRVVHPLRRGGLGKVALREMR